MKTKIKRSMKVILACAISLALVLSTYLFFGKESSDKAQAVDNVVASYEAAKAQVAQCKSEYDAMMAKALEINGRIEQTAKEAMSAQNEMIKKQEQFRRIIKHEYVNSTQFSLLTTLLDSENFVDFLKNMDYANAVMDYQFRLAREQRQRKDAYDGILKNLQEESAQQNACLEAADKKVAEANATLDSIRSKLTPAQLAELEGIISGGGGTGGGGGGYDPGPSPTPSPDPGPQPSPGS